MPPELPRGGPDRKGLWLPVLFFICGLLITSVVVYHTQHVVRQEQQAQWEAEATRIRSDLSLHIYRHIDALRAYQVEFFTHPHFSEVAFQRVAQVLKIREQLPGIDAVGYVRPQRSPDGDGDFLLRVVYLYDRPGEQPALATHVQTDPVRRDAILRARDSGDMAATGPLRSHINPKRPEIFLVFLPLYGNGLIPVDTAARHESFEGAVFLALQPARLMESVLGAQPAVDAYVRLRFEGYVDDGSPQLAPITVYDNLASERFPEHALRTQLPLTVGGTQWTLDVAMAGQYQAVSQQWLAWAVGAAGLLISLFGASVIVVLQRARLHSQQRASADRSLRREAEVALHLRERAIEASANAIVIASATKPGYPVDYVNPAFERMTGYSAEEVLGGSLRLMHGMDTEQEGLAELKKILEEKTEGQVTLRNYRKDGQMYWSRVHIAPVRDENGAVTHFVAAKYDITQTRLYQETLEFQACHDALTLLPNRHALRERLTQAIAECRQGGPAFWVAFLDLDNFKLMNDSLGHTQGDIAIQQIAKRLEENLHECDMVARRGGDEFVFILFDHKPPRNAQASLHRIMSAVSRPLRLGTQRFHPTASVGIAIHPQDGDDPEVLIKHADMAMYAAKNMGRNTAQFFSEKLMKQAMQRVTLEADLHSALANQEFELHYQPQISLADGRLTGVEALVRWRHPTRGLVPPGEFIALAEETGLIIPLGDWILRTACKQAAKWRAQGMQPMRMAVNLSARQFRERELPVTIQCVLRDTLLDPSYLELELTESLLAEDVEAANHALRTLKKIGVTLSLDDFGTGYSSMAQLKNFPLDIMKIDRSFVSDIEAEHSGGAIVRAIIKLAHNLGMIALAEGVETAGQHDFLKEHGCDVIQGYLISRPLPAAEFEQWLATRQELLPHA
ncbi:MAG TPA: EAL domain-containing protein [Burkholderiaceae bacterium]|nr:EAL domain-containing protein [Burkholderiaceae bacterium]